MAFYSEGWYGGRRDYIGRMDDGIAEMNIQCTQKGGKREKKEE